MLAAVRLRGSGLETSEYVVCLAERRDLRIVAAFLAIVRAARRGRPPAT